MAEIKIGQKSLQIDGIEIAQQVRSYRLVWDGPKTLPTLFCEIFSRDGVDLDIEGNVDFTLSETPAHIELRRITKVLASLNPAKLEEEALAAQEWGDAPGSLTQYIVKTIQEQVLGNQDRQSQEDGEPPAPG